MLLDHQSGYYYYIIRIKRPLTVRGFYLLTHSVKLQAVYMLFGGGVNYELCAIGHNTDHSMKQNPDMLLLSEPMAKSFDPLYTLTHGRF